MYQIVITRAAKKQMRKVHTAYLPAIDAKIKSLATNPLPDGCKKLRAIKHVGHAAYRVRVGPYRILYTIQGRELIVTVFEVADRKDSY